MSKQYGDVRVELRDYVAEVEMQRPPHNYFDVDLIRSLGDAFEDLDSNRECRALVLAAAGKSFCAGANLPARGSGPADPQEMNPLYTEALRLFACRKPVVAAIQGAAVGGGLGVALVADFRVTGPVCRQLHPPGISSGFWSESHPAGTDRAAKGGSDVLHRPAYYGRAGGGLGVGR